MANNQTDHVYDVVVIGTGAAGALAAYHLKEAGLDVVMLEAGKQLPEEGSRRQLREQYATSSSKAVTAPYVGFVAPQPNHDDKTFDGSDYYDQFKHTKDQHSDSYYQRTVGGAMAHWQGIAIRMVPSDFTLKSTYLDKSNEFKGQGMDWPISYNDLEEFYQEVEKQWGVAGSEEMDRLLKVPRPSGGYPMPPVPFSYHDKLFLEKLKGKKFDIAAGQEHGPKAVNVDLTATPQARNTKEYDGRLACQGYGTCIPLCPIRAKYESLFHVEKAMAKGAELRTQVIVTRLEVDGQNRVIAAHYFRWDEKGKSPEESVRGRLFVLAANAIETPMILLRSNLANSSDLVGRNLMDHPLKISYGLAKDKVYVYPFRGPPTTAAIETFRDGTFRSEFGGFRTSIRNDGWSLLNTSPRGNNPPAGDLDESNYRGTLLELVGRQAKERENKPKKFGKELRDEFIDKTHRQILLYSACEMLPDKNNRVQLSALTGDFGLARPKITFDIGNYARKSLVQARKLHEQILKGWFGVSTTDGKPDMWLDAHNVPSTSKDDRNDIGSGHIIGTTVMGENPRTSVVDPYGRAHDCPNLFIMGSSVFPTAAVANPTLTLAALVLRSIPQIKQDFHNSGI